MKQHTAAKNNKRNTPLKGMDKIAGIINELTSVTPEVTPAVDTPADIPLADLDKIAGILDKILPPAVDTPAVTPNSAMALSTTPAVSVTPGITEYAIGIPNDTRRVTKGADVKEWRVCTNQRKNVNARYYVQGGYYLPHVNNPNRSMFTVSVEIPHVELRSAQLDCKERNALLALERSKLA